MEPAPAQQQQQHEVVVVDGAQQENVSESRYWVCRTAMKGFRAVRRGIVYCVTFVDESVKGFQDFLLRGRISELAAAFIIGSSFNALITSFMKTTFSPIMGVITGKDTPFSEACIPMGGECLRYGSLMMAIVTFATTIIMLYYVVIVPLDKMMVTLHGDRYRKRDCPYCCSRVPNLAIKCSGCGSELPLPESSQGPQSSSTADAPSSSTSLPPSGAKSPK
jgi:large conductance mechanosensitive channel